MRLLHALLALSPLALASVGHSQLTGDDTLVLDLIPGPAGGNPLQGATLGDRYVFRTQDGAGFQSVWISDGSAGTTEQLASGFTGIQDPNLFAEVGELVIWKAGSQLYRTDGTPEGTFAFLDVNTLFTVEFFLWIEPLGDTGRALVATRENFGPMHLLVTDGSAEGTLDEIVVSNAQDRISFGNLIYFGGVDSGVGDELYVTDGSPGGTKLVKDIDPDDSGMPRNFARVGDEIFFESNGTLWKSDGTEAGTVMVADPTGTPRRLVALGDRLLFFSGFTYGELWTSDGTAVGTFQLSFIGPSDDGIFQILPVVAGSVAYFFARPVPGEVELWVTDGTVAGTTKVTDLDYSSGVGLTDGRLIFTKTDPVLGAEPHVTEGTEATTTLLADVASGAAGSGATRYYRAGTNIFITANDGVIGSELHSVTVAEAGGWVVENYGVGCGTTSPPRITSSLTPTLGDTFGIGAEGAPLTGVSLFLSADPFFESLGSDCAGLIESPLFAGVFATDATGSGELLFQVPNLPPIVGLPFYFQAALSTGTGPYGGLELTGGLEVILGS
ncbi:MAG: hypothetical protein AAF682_06205 [Planctomycetota bacterium]